MIDGIRGISGNDFGSSPLSGLNGPSAASGGGETCNCSGGGAQGPQDSVGLSEEAMRMLLNAGR
ncbi:MAG: hypothetical protein AB1758_24340 [Candidatus Eremiobacterota bacterium]